MRHNKDNISYHFSAFYFPCISHIALLTSAICGSYLFSVTNGLHSLCLAIAIRLFFVYLCNVFGKPNHYTDANLRQTGHKSGCGKTEILLITT